MSAELPSGRKLWYFDPKLIRKEMPWSTEDEPDIRWAWTCKMRKGAKWITVDMYGGLETENVIQALARDLLWVAAFKCEREGLPIVLTVYDEILCEPLIRNDNQKVLEQIMTDSPKWALDIGVPVQVEAWTGDRYRK
jgi:DNA polymerase